MSAPDPRQSLSDDSDVAQARRERDLYRRLLELGCVDAPEHLVEEALALVVGVTGGHQGYLELHDDPVGSGSVWSVACGMSPEQIAGVRDVVSRGIITQALVTGETVVTPSAADDPRFGRDGARVGHIGAVLCAPIGATAPRGVVYLHRRASPRMFSAEARVCVETFAAHLVQIADRVIQRARDRSQADPTHGVRQRLRLDGVIGRSHALASVLQQVALVAPLDVSVLLTGDTGTGKSQIARVIHDNGPRAARPFVELNCAALPDELIESELFGAMPGAHSTATRRIPGKVAAAEGGTLFLDEVAELSQRAQAKLLQLLQSKEYYPLGASRAIEADVRVIAASNSDLRQAVAGRTLREDLYYRLQVLPLSLPTLAERHEDIPLLAQHFCDEACRRHRLPHLRLSPNALRATEVASWPGNIRQLEHTIEAATIRAAGAHAPQVECPHIFPDTPAAAVDAGHTLTFQEATRRFQAQLLRETLELRHWNIVETARHLDLARSHVYNLIRAFGLMRGPS